MKYQEITFVCTILCVPLVQRSCTTASSYVVLSMTKNGLLELHLVHGKHRFLETSLAFADSVHRISVTSATDGLRVVRSVTRDGRLDNCITSTSSQDVASCTSKFSPASGNLVKLSEADVMDAYLTFNQITYPTFLLRRGESNIFSIMSPEKTGSQSVANFPDFSLWARINSTGNSPFLNMFRTHLQVAKKTHECKTLHEKAIRAIQIINILVRTDLNGIGNLAAVNKTAHTSIRLRHRPRLVASFKGDIHEAFDLYRPGEADSFNTSTSKRAISSDISSISRSSEESRLEDILNITFTRGEHNTPSAVENRNVHSESVNKSPGLYSFPFVPWFPTNRWRLGGVTERVTTHVTGRHLRKYTNIGTDRNLQTGRNHETDKHFGMDRHSLMGRYRRAYRHQGSDRHFNSQNEPESDIHQEPVGCKETNKRKLTHIHRKTEHGPDIHHHLDRSHKAQISVGIDRLRGSEKRYQLDEYESDRLYTPYRRHRTDGLHASDRRGETDKHVWSDRRGETDKHVWSDRRGETDKHVWSDRRGETDKHVWSDRLREKRNEDKLNDRGNNQLVSNIHYKDRQRSSDRQHSSDKYHMSDRHHQPDRQHRSDRHVKTKTRKHHKTHQHDEPHIHDKTDKRSHIHHTDDRHAGADRLLETASVSLLRPAANASDRVTIGNTEATANSKRGAGVTGQEVGSTHGDPSRSRRDLFTGWMIFPGTKWCGDGDIAEHKQDMGYHSELDMCCRRHDLCPLVIPRLTWKYGFFNYRLHTLSHCACDRKLRKCLKAASSPLAHLIGQIYFNVIGPECFKFTQRTTCVQRLWWGGCQEWSTNKVAYLKRQRRFK